MSWTIGGRTFTYRKKITIGSTGKGLSGSVSNIPIVVHADNSADWSTGGGNNFWQHVDNVSGAVAFSADASTALDFDVESWDYTNKDAWWHVEVGTINTTDTDIYIYYKDEGTATDLSNAAGTWGNSFHSVYHFNTGYGAGIGDDALGSYDGTVNGAIDAAGQIDRCADFDGINDDISTSDGTDFTNLSVEVWVKRDSTTTYDLFITNWTAGNNGWIFGCWNSGGKFSFYDASSWYHSNTGLVGDTNWHHVGFTIDSSGNLTFYEAGAPVGTASTAGVPTSSNNLSFGTERITDHINGLAGLLDGLTFSNVVRSADWFICRYQAGLGTWLTIGAEETSGATIHTVDVTDGMLMEDPNQRDQSHLLLDNLLLSDSATTQLAQVINLVSQVDGLLIDDSFRFELQKLLLDPALIGDDRSSIIEKILADSLFVSDSVTAQKISGLVTVLVTDGLFLSDNLTMIREMVNLTNVFLSDFAIKHRELSLRDYLLLSETQDIAKTTGRIVTQLVTDGLLLADETIRDMPLTAIDSVLLSTSRQSLRELLDYTNLLLSDSATALKGAEVVITDFIYLRDDRLSEQTKQVLEHVILASLMVKILEALKVDTSLLVRDSTTIATIQAFAQALVYAKTKTTDIIGAKLKAVDIMGIKYGVVQ